MGTSLKTLLWIFLIGLLVFSNGLHGPLLIDDHSFFERKIPAIKHLSQALFPGTTFPGSPYAPYFRPLSLLVPALYYWGFGIDTFIYHLLNLILFCLASWAIYLFARRRLNAGHGTAFLAAIFFLVHPINGLAVNYITASVFSLQVIFMLAALYFMHNIFLWALFFILGVSCHETAMLLPFYAALLCFVQSNRPTFTQKIAEIWPKLQPLIIVLGLFLIFRMFYASLQIAVVNKVQVYDEMNLVQYIATSGMLLFWYLSRLVWMQNIVLIMSHQPLKEGLALWILALVLLAFAAGYLLWKYRRDTIAFTGLTWFMAGFAPYPLMCLFQPVHGLMIEPHWFFFSSIGLFIFLASVFSRLLEQKKKWVRPALGVLLVCAVFFSRWHNWVWADEVRYCSFWLKQSPDFIGANSFLAEGYEKKGNIALARHHYETVLKLGYNLDFVYEHLGLLCLMEGNWKEARRNFMKLLQHSPISGETLNNIGATYKEEGNSQQAVRYFALAAQYSPKNPRAYLNAADLFVKLGKSHAAANILEQLLAEVPGQENAMVELAKIYMEDKATDKLIPLARQMSIHSRNPYTLRNAGIILERNGLNDEGQRVKKRAERILNSHPGQE